MTRDDLDLTPEEQAQLKRLLAIEARLVEMEKADSRAQWGWSFLGRCVKWLFATAAGIGAMKLAFGDLITRLFK